MGAPNSSDNRLDRLTPRPRITLVHYTAPPVVGGVEAVLSEQARLFAAAGCPTTVVAGRGSPSALGAAVRVTILPEMDSRHGGSDGFAPPAGQFEAACQRLERALGEALGPDEIVIAHNVLTTHFNLPLTAALFRLAEQGRLGRLDCLVPRYFALRQPGLGRRAAPGRAVGLAAPIPAGGDLRGGVVGTPASPGSHPGLPARRDLGGAQRR